VHKKKLAIVPRIDRVSIWSNIDIVVILFVARYALLQDVTIPAKRE